MTAVQVKRLFPEDSAERKTYPVFSGFAQYFPSAMAAIAHHSWLGNQKHNPGQPLHHDRAKSDDEADALLRHLMEGDEVGMGWRAMSLLQKHLEANGAPIAPGARNAVPESRTHAPAVEHPGSLDALRIERGGLVDHRKAGEIMAALAVESQRLGLYDDDEGLAPGEPPRCRANGTCE